MARQAGKEEKEGKEEKAEIPQIEGAGSTRLGVCVGERLAIGKQLARPGVVGGVAGGQTTYINIYVYIYIYVVYIYVYIYIYR